MFCNYCGSPVPGVAKFCRKCGKPIAPSQQPSAAATTAATPPPVPELRAETIQARPIAAGTVPSGPSATEPRKVRAGRRIIAAVAASIALLLIGALILTRGRSGRPRTFVGHTGSVTSLAFSRDGRMLASGSVDGTVKLWDMTSGQWLRTLPSYQASIWVAFSPDGHTLAAWGGPSGHRLMSLWDAASGNQMHVLVDNADGPAEFSPDGRLLVTVDDRGDDDFGLRVWEAASGKELHRLAGFKEPKFSPDGKLMAAWNKVQSISLLDVDSGNEVRAFDQHFRYLQAVVFSPDGRLLATTEGTTIVNVWDVASGKEVRNIEDSNTVRGIAFSPDSRLLAFGSDETITLWDVASGNKVRTLSGHSAWVNCVAFSPDGRWLAAGGDDSKILVWPLPQSP